MSVLDDIVAGASEDAAAREATLPLAELRARALATPTPRDPKPAFAAPGLSVIAEVKRKSPSKGVLASIPDPAELAAKYAAGGADAISVLTESRRFDGSLADLVAVRRSVPTPLLRKDFIVSEYQLLEARHAGADLALLIVAALDDQALGTLHGQALDLGLTPLVETHNAEEIERALAVGAQLIGVNARNLKTLAVDPDTFGRLAGLIPDGVLKVAESGISGVADAERYRAEGADVVLVGEALVKDGDPTAAVRAMRAVGTAAGRAQ